MIGITLITVGKLKEPYLRSGCDEYIKRMGAYAKVNIIEVAEQRSPDNPSSMQVKQIIGKEGERIIEKIPKGAAVIPLCIEGKEYTSPDFSAFIESVAMEHSNITFIIGGSFGLSDDVKAVSSSSLSFGRLTLPHQLARLVLLEQIYRAFSISNNAKYHK